MVRRRFVCLPAYLSVYLPVSLSLCLSAFLSVCLSACPFMGFGLEFLHMLDDREGGGMVGIGGGRGGQRTYKHMVKAVYSSGGYQKQQNRKKTRTKTDNTHQHILKLI